MPTYVSLLNWTDQGIRNVRDTLDRAKRAEEAAEKYGVRFVETYYTVGPYDIVTVVEAADEESATAVLLALGAAGNVRSTTLRAYEREEMSAIVERLEPPAST
ncbi:MAG TPA: GYD domain-containing protein [Rubrobacteraceae bacterium]|nr:GYD domain-containing protein [Rubrobacteraceae bacterium]